MQQRYYDPQAGRFLSVDPIASDAGSGGNFNRYWYANDNPYRFKDPDGRLQAPTFQLPAGLTELPRVVKSSATAAAYQKGASLPVQKPISLPTRHQVAVAADNVSSTAGKVEIAGIVTGQPEVAGPAGIVSLGASAVATAAEPTPERKMSLGFAVATFGVSKGLGKMGHEIPEKSVALGNDIVEQLTQKR
jgi:uncharacterized protein RhaS with RHS repeats